MKQLALEQLIQRIETSRTTYLAAVSGLTKAQTKFKPGEKEWSILEITEHLVWAEQVGVCGMFNAIDGLKNKQPIWEGISPNKGLSIEQIVANTWQSKEVVPKVAEPRWGGAINFWIHSLKNCSHLLQELMVQTAGVDLNVAIYPHPISGPMDVVQRLEFLSFHIDRHLLQVNRVKAHPDFPTL